MTHDQPGPLGPQTWVPQGAPTPQPPSQPQAPFQPPTAPGYQGPTAQPGYEAPSAPGYPGQAPSGQPNPFGQPNPYGQPNPVGQPNPYGQPAPYAQPTYYGPPAPRRTPTLAILGLVFAFLAPLVGLVLSIVALVRAKTDGNGRGLAIAGLVTSIVMTPLYAAVALPVFLHQRELAQEAGPRDAFERMTTALAEGDCEVFMAGSTASLREQLGTTTCDEFQSFVAVNDAGAVQVGNVPITDVEIDGDRATVSTIERVQWAEGEPATTQAFDYTMVRRDGVWLMDGVTLGD